MSNQHAPDADLMRDFTAQFGESKEPQQKLEAIAARMQAVKSMMAMIADMEGRKLTLLKERRDGMLSLQTEITDVQISIQTKEEILERMQNPERVETECNIKDEQGRTHNHRMVHHEWVWPSGERRKTAKAIIACSLHCDAANNIEISAQCAKSDLEILEGACKSEVIAKRILELQIIKTFLSECGDENVIFLDGNYVEIDSDKIYFAQTYGGQISVRSSGKGGYEARVYIGSSRSSVQQLAAQAIALINSKLHQAIQRRDKRVFLRSWSEHLSDCTGDQTDLKSDIQQLRQALDGLNVKLHDLESKLKQSQETSSEVLETLTQTIEKYRRDVQSLIGSSETVAAPALSE